MLLTKFNNFFNRCYSFYPGFYRRAYFVCEPGTVFNDILDQCVGGLGITGCKSVGETGGEGERPEDGDSSSSISAEQDGGSETGDIDGVSEGDTTETEVESETGDSGTTGESIVPEIGDADNTIEVDKPDKIPDGTGEAESETEDTDNASEDTLESGSSSVDAENKPESGEENGESDTESDKLSTSDTEDKGEEGISENDTTSETDKKPGAEDVDDTDKGSATAEDPEESDLETENPGSAIEEDILPGTSETGEEIVDSEDKIGMGEESETSGVDETDVGEDPGTSEGTDEKDKIDGSETNGESESEVVTEVVTDDSHVEVETSGTVGVNETEEKETESDGTATIDGGDDSLGGATELGGQSSGSVDKESSSGTSVGVETGVETTGNEGAESSSQIDSETGGMDDNKEGKPETGGTIEESSPDNTGEGVESGTGDKDTPAEVDLGGQSGTEEGKPETEETVVDEETKPETGGTDETEENKPETEDKETIGEGDIGAETIDSPDKETGTTSTTSSSIPCPSCNIVKFDCKDHTVCPGPSYRDPVTLHLCRVYATDCCGQYKHFCSEGEYYEPNQKKCYPPPGNK